MGRKQAAGLVNDHAKSWHMNASSVSISIGRNKKLWATLGQRSTLAVWHSGRLSWLERSTRETPKPVS